MPGTRGALRRGVDIATSVLVWLYTTAIVLETRKGEFALALALALNRATRGAAIFRGIFFSSAVLSVTIVTLIWRFILAPDAGLLGELWTALGWEPLPFLSAPHLTLPALAKGP